MKIKKNRILRGKLTGINNNLIHGWVLCETDSSPLVELLFDNAVVLVITADMLYPYEYNKEEIESFKEQSRKKLSLYGFLASLPIFIMLQGGRLSARLANNAGELDGYIQLFANNQESESIVSAISNHGDLRIYGFAVDPMRPYRHLSIKAYEGSELVAETTANLPRTDLIDRNIGTGRHGFDLTLPISIADGRTHKIRLVTDSGAELKGSPIEVVASPELTSLAVSSLAKDIKSAGILKTLLKRYERLIPASIDFSEYKSWFGAFENPLPPLNADNTDTCVIVFGERDIDISLKSIDEQLLNPTQVLNISSLTPKSDYEFSVVSADRESLFTYLEENKLLNAWLIPLKAGDKLHSNAILHLSHIIAKHREDIGFIYADNDFIDKSGNRHNPWFKPDWDIDLYLALPFLSGLTAFKASLSDKKNISELPPDLWHTSVIKKLLNEPDKILHIPSVLYHCSDNNFLIDMPISIRQEIAPGTDYTKINYKYPCYKVNWPEPDTWPVVSLVIPTKDKVNLLKPCIDSILKTDYPYIEIIIVDNLSKEKETFDYFRSLSPKKTNKSSKNIHNNDIKIQILKWDEQFNYSAINNFAVKKANGSIIGLINNDIEATEANWLKSMVKLLMRPDVGVVGAKLLWPNVSMVQHAGVVIGLHGLAGHTGNDWMKDDPGYFGYNLVARQQSAVTAACLLCKKEDYLLIGGLDAEGFPVNFNDVDFCLKIRKLGKLVIWTPDATLLHHESASRGDDIKPDKAGRLEREKQFFYRRWINIVDNDPFYNPNLNLDRYSYLGLAFPPRNINILFNS